MTMMAMAVFGMAMVMFRMAMVMFRMVMGTMFFHKQQS
jgi:hypothetical protein